MEYREGDRVSYEDIANPRRVGTIVGQVEGGPSGTSYEIEFDDQAYPHHFSDCRQAGWRREAGAR